MDRNLYSAPLSDEEIATFRAWQRSSYVHPLTCANRGDGNHPEGSRDRGILNVTDDGKLVYCEWCAYVQVTIPSYVVDTEVHEIVKNAIIGEFPR